MSTDLLATMINEISTPNIVTVLSVAGFDAVVIDCEHGPFSCGEVSAMATAGRACDAQVFVRAPGIDRGFLGKHLDLGLAGVVIPMVSTPAQAEEVVRLTRYPPLGERGVSTTRPHTGYRVADLGSYLARTNAELQVLVQIETAAGLAAVDQIAAVRGISGLVIGPNDLLVDLGRPGALGDPALRTALTTVASAAQRNGLRSGIITSDRDLLAAARTAGMDWLVWNSEVGLLLGPGRDALTAVREALVPDPFHATNPLHSTNTEESHD